MGEPKLSKILIGALLVGLFSLAFMLFISEGAEEYDIEGYSNSSLAKFKSDSENISIIAQQAEKNLSGAGAGSGSAFDIFGSFFSSSWTALKSTWSSITTLQDLSRTAVDNIPNVNSSFSEQLKIVFTTIIIITLVIGVFFHFVNKSSRL